MIVTIGTEPSYSSESVYKPFKLKIIHLLQQLNLGKDYIIIQLFNIFLH